MSNNMKIVDCRGIEIKEGSIVITSSLSGRLYEKQVKRIEQGNIPHWWINIRFTDGSYTTPEQVAVIK